MPIIQIHLLEGRTREQKSRLAKAITGSVIEILGNKPESIRILFNNMSKEDYSVAGVLKCDEKG